MTDHEAPAGLVRAARRWLAEDPDPSTRTELERILEEGDTEALRDRFGGRLEFGTAGLRGEMGAGPNRMNRATVRYAAAGLVRYLAADPSLDPNAPLVIGYDARHHSREFAADTARVAAAARRPALLLPAPLPTPVLAFAVRHLRAAAGVMVTASHNPARDNGYKVYGADGAQIVPPVDADIAAAIDSFQSLAEIPLAGEDDPLVEVASRALVDAYVAFAAGTLIGPPPAIRVAYTPLHGVGWAVVERVFEQAGLGPPAVVPDQAVPDPDFPTVAFPNPEESGAMDAVIALATEIGADVAIANDPDADRLAVAVPDEGSTWRRLTGDEVGWLLADQLLRRPAPTGDARRPLVATTLVSSRMLAKIAAYYGAVFEQTLTGFKWLARPAIANPHLRPVLAYEEALGYAVGDARDKDGITAAVAFVELLGALASEGTTVADRLRVLAERHGAHATGQVSLRREGPGGVAEIAAIMARLRDDPPAKIGSRAIVRMRDYLIDTDRGGLPATDAVVLELDGGARIVVRPSGTEPKAKVYGEVVATSMADARAALGDVLSSVVALIDEDEA